MATRDELYAKFGMTAEAAQLFETALGTLLLGAEGLKGEWAEKPDLQDATDKYAKINKSTLGQLLRSARTVVDLDEDLIDMFGDALDTRNKLMHGFYLRHNFAIQTDAGRDSMIEDLEETHTILYNAWQIADQLSGVLLDYIMELKNNPDAKGRGPVEKIQFQIRRQ